MMRALMLTILATPALVAAQDLSCPLLLPDRAVEVAHPPAGWLRSSNGPARLTGGGLMSGHPTLRGYDKPAQIKKMKGGRVSTWSFVAGEEKWFYCAYGSTAIQLSKRMDDAATECSVVAKDDKLGGLAEMTVACKR